MLRTHDGCAVYRVLGEGVELGRVIIRDPEDDAGFVVEETGRGYGSLGEAVEAVREYGAMSEGGAA